MRRPILEPEGERLEVSQILVLLADRLGLIPEIPDELLTRSLERLAVTKVVEERTPQVYEFSVPDYPLILNRLGDMADLERAERKLQAYLGMENEIRN